MKTGNATITFDSLPQIVAEISEKQDALFNLLTKKEEKVIIEPSVSDNIGIDTLLDLIEELTGHRTARQTVYGYINRRSIPFKKRGKRLVFSREKIKAWLENGRSMQDLAF